MGFHFRVSGLGFQYRVSGLRFRVRVLITLIIIICFFFFPLKTGPPNHYFFTPSLVVVYRGTFDGSHTSRMLLPGSLGANQRTVPEQRGMRADGRDLPRPSALVTDSVRSGKTSWRCSVETEDLQLRNRSSRFRQ